MTTGGEQNYNNDIQNLYRECVTPVLKTLLLQRVEELKDPDLPEGKWTLKLFLHKNKRKIIPCLRDHHLEDVLYPFEEPTNLENWDFAAYVLVLLNACRLNQSLQQDLVNLEELANKIQLCSNNKLSEGIYYAYQDRIRCRIIQICKSLDDGGNSHNLLSRFEEMCPLISRSKYPNGFAQKFEKDVQVVSQRDSDAITYLEWIEDRLKSIGVNPLIPEIEVIVILKHYNQSDEQRVSRYIETAFMEAVKKYDVAVSTSEVEKELNPNQEEAAFFESEDVKKYIQFLVRRLFEGQQRVTSVTTGCVKLKIQCETVRAVIDLIEQSINGLLTFVLATLEDEIRLIHGHELFDIYVGVTRESCWKLVNEMKTAAYGGYRSGRLHEKLTFNHKRIEDGQMIIIKSRPTTVTSVQDLRRIVSSDERMQTCREFSELLTRQFRSSEGTINMSVKVVPDIKVVSNKPYFIDWKEDGTLDIMADTRTNYDSLHHVYPKDNVSELGRKSFDIINIDADSSPSSPPHANPITAFHFGVKTTEVSKRMQTGLSEMTLKRSSLNKDMVENDTRAVQVKSKYEPGTIMVNIPNMLLDMGKLRLEEGKSGVTFASNDEQAYYEYKRRGPFVKRTPQTDLGNRTYQRTGDSSHDPTDAMTLKYVSKIELLGKDGHVEYGSTFGMAFVGDRFLVSTDAAKKCVRCFDMVREKQQVGRYDIAEMPFGITTIPDNRVAVTSADKVWFLRVTEKGDLLFENKLHVNKRCLGIASSDDNLIVCYRHPAPGVQILDMKGNVIKEIRSILKKDDDDERLFVWPAAVAVSPDHCTIYITDMTKNTVTALTQDGCVLGVVNVKVDILVSGITVDSAGRVYVGGCDTVFLVSFETGTVTPLLITDCIGPFNAVAVCDKTQRLYVSPEYDNVIRVFEMPKHTTA